MGPSGMSFHDTTNCSTFSKFGRFNPYSVLHEKWFVFFYWAHPRPLTTFLFTFPTANHTKHLKKILDGNTILPVMWSARQILMEDQDKEVSLLVERGDRGEYWNYPLYKVDRKGLFDALAKHEIPDSAKTNPITIPSLSLRMKIEDPYLVMMFCEEYYATIMAISGQEPTTLRDIKAELATIKFVGKGRPVWRDYEGEKEKIKLEQEAKIQEERDKYLN
uniref:Uncharacterized protein n=1 Tax=Heliothis virescens TaxID=7102 RepID=A0A2A4JEH5_HELVI